MMDEIRVTTVSASSAVADEFRASLAVDTTSPFISVTLAVISSNDAACSSVALATLAKFANILKCPGES